MAAMYKRRNNGQTHNILGGNNGAAPHIQQALHREDVIRKVDQDRVLLANMRSEVRVDNLRYLRGQQQRRNEDQMERSIQAEKEKRESHRKQLEIDENLCQQLETERNQHIREAKMRQYIRENSPELRQLELKLKAAYMNRERVAQVNEMRSKTEIERKREHEFVMARDKVLVDQKEAEDRKQQMKVEQAMETRRQLEQQLAERERQKQMDYEEFLKEKLMIDDIVRQIHLEDEAMQRDRQQQQEETRKYISEFEKSRTTWKQEAKEETARKEREISEFGQARKLRDAARQAVKKKERAERDLVYQKLATKLDVEENAKRESRRVRDELYFEEQKHNMRLDEEAKARKLRDARLGLRLTQAEQLEMRAETVQKAKEDEEMFRKRMMEKFQEDERIQLLKDEQRKQKQIEFKQVVDRLMEERRHIAEAERRQEEIEQQKQQKEESYRQQLYEEEKRRLIKEHGANLVDYLPKGVLRHEDLDLLGEDTKARFLNGKTTPTAHRGHSQARGMATLSLREL